MTAPQLAFDFPGWRLLEKVSRRARRIRVEIVSIDEVLLVIPHRASRHDARAFLHSRIGWIERKLAQLRRARATPAIALRGGDRDRKTLIEAARREAEYWLAIEAERLHVQPRGLRMGDPKTLWGSCGANGRISLSWRLALAPPEVLRYVVIHELAHLVHRNHSRRFWEVVARQMPGYAAAGCASTAVRCTQLPRFRVAEASRRRSYCRP